MKEDKDQEAEGRREGRKDEGRKLGQTRDERKRNKVGGGGNRYGGEKMEGMCHQGDWKKEMKVEGDKMVQRKREKEK